jgi:pyridoxine/pyridoxamine 5'-phosphate oxidase
MSDGRSPDFQDDLDTTLEAAWQLLEQRAVKRQTGLPVMQAASVGKDGAPRVRSVVLRGADAAGRQVQFHSDINAGKVGELHANPAIALVFYDAEERVQIQLRGRADIHKTGSVADAAWRELRGDKRAGYSSEPRHGEPIASARAYAAEIDPSDPDAGRASFCTILVTITELEWYRLHDAGHARCRFRWNGGCWSGQWLVP